MWVEPAADRDDLAPVAYFALPVVVGPDCIDSTVRPHTNRVVRPRVAVGGEVAEGDGVDARLAIDALEVQQARGGSDPRWKSGFRWSPETVLAGVERRRPPRTASRARGAAARCGPTATRSGFLRPFGQLVRASSELAVVVSRGMGVGQPLRCSAARAVPCWCLPGSGESAPHPLGGTP